MFLQVSSDTDTGVCKSLALLYYQDFCFACSLAINSAMVLIDLIMKRPRF